MILESYYHSPSESIKEEEKMKDFILWIPEFISLTGSTVYGKFHNDEISFKANDKDIIVRSERDRLRIDNALRLKVDRLLKSIYGSSFRWERVFSKENEILVDPKIAKEEKEIQLIRDFNFNSTIVLFKRECRNVER